MLNVRNWLLPYGIRAACSGMAAVARSPFSGGKAANELASRHDRHKARRRRSVLWRDHRLSGLFFGATRAAQPRAAEPKYGELHAASRLYAHSDDLHA